MRRRKAEVGELREKCCDLDLKKVFLTASKSFCDLSVFTAYYIISIVNFILKHILLTQQCVSFLLIALTFRMPSDQSFGRFNM